MKSIKKDRRWLFTDWSFGLNSFKIYDSFDTFNFITGRTIIEGKNINWFNLDNIEREIRVFGDKNNIKIMGLKETLSDLKNNGFCYNDKNKNHYILEAEKRSNIKIIE